MYRRNKAILLFGFAAAVALAIPVERTSAAFQDIPESLPYRPGSRNSIERLQFDQPALPPFAYSVFCLHLPKECEIKRVAMRHGRIALNDERRAELVTVNTIVNRAIAPERKSANVLQANWTISPPRGDCNDYAITKRHELEVLGWPTNALLLAEVITNWGEHHLVLVVNTREGDFVLDNLTQTIRRWSETPYHRVRMQSPKDPKLWSMVRTGTS
jgi:predicted transglutaminase-like cysteine proteinase